MDLRIINPVIAVMTLIGNTLTLLSLVTGFVDLDEISGKLNPPMLLALSALLLCYGWGSLSWYLLQRNIESNLKKGKSLVGATVYAPYWQSVFGIGLLLLPVAFLWFLYADSQIKHEYDSTKFVLVGFVGSTVVLGGVFSAAFYLLTDTKYH